MKWIAIVPVLVVLLLAGCAVKAQSTGESYRQIDQETAKQMMEQDDGHLIVDVRRFDEYRAGHIPGAICLPNEEIETERPEDLPKLDQILLIYCRSGNRSKQASEKLAAMGYSRIYEFGGIIDWTGEIVTGQSLVLTVESNPTTGYSWTVEQEPELFALREFYASQTPSQPVSGMGGWQSFILTPRQAGTARLSFTYSRPWEPGEADPQFSCVFEVAEDLSITVAEDGSANAAEQGYPPVVRIYG